MQGQVFTVAKLHYVHGVVYFAAREGHTDLSTLAKHSKETTKSGNVKHPMVRVLTLVRFAEGLGLVTRAGRESVQVSELGKRYYEARPDDQWSLSNPQKSILRDHILSDISRSPTIHAITSLLSLVGKGLTGKALSRQYAIEIEKEDAWHSDVTYEGFTKFGLNYLNELGFGGEGLNLQQFNIHKRTAGSPGRAKRTFLFTWNPSKWKWDYLPQAVFEANAEGRYIEKWTCASKRNISPGDRAFLMRLGVPPKGIMGSGVVVSDPFEDRHYDPRRAEQGVTAYHVDILFGWCTVLSVILYSTDLLLELWSCGREINECGQTVGWWEPLIHGLSIRPEGR